MRAISRRLAAAAVTPPVRSGCVPWQELGELFALETVAKLDTLRLEELLVG